VEPKVGFEPTTDGVRTRWCHVRHRLLAFAA
jgi:hypothetical protein